MNVWGWIFKVQFSRSAWSFWYDSGSSGLSLSYVHFYWLSPPNAAYGWQTPTSLSAKPAFPWASARSWWKGGIVSSWFQAFFSQGKKGCIYFLVTEHIKTKCRYNGPEFWQLPRKAWQNSLSPSVFEWCVASIYSWTVWLPLPII